MIVYIATYPRSGNSLVQRIVGGNFRYLITQVKAGFRSPDAALRLLQAAKQAEIVHTPTQDRPWPEEVEWNQWLALCRLRGEEWRRIILHSTLDAYTDTFREALAREANVFFVKTHHLPFPRYFEGEFVVQVVRHPGATLWSYFRYLHDFILARGKDRMFAEPPMTLERVIRGDVNFGSWSSYYREWSKADELLGERYLLTPFEELIADQPAFSERLGAWLHLPAVAHGSVDFEAFRAKFPGKDLRGTSDGYERFYTRGQLDLLWSEHGETALKYGYRHPDFGLGSPDEQIRRLEQLILAAWTAAQARRPGLRPAVAGAGTKT